MEQTIEKTISSNIFHSLSASLSFTAFGITAFVNLADPYKIVNLIYGTFIGLIFGFLCKLFLKAFLRMFNGDVKKSYGKKAIKHAVNRGMAFMLPFGVMSLLSTFVLGWSLTGGFVSAGIMTAAASAAMEIAQLTGKPGIKNTIITSIVAWCFSTLWLLGAGFLGKFPAYLEGGIKLLSSLKGS